MFRKLLVIIFGITLFYPSLTFAITVFPTTLEQRVHGIGKNGPIIEGECTKAEMVTMPNGYVATECTFIGEVLKGSPSMGVEASPTPQEIKIRMYGYGNIGIAGMPRCNVGEKGMFFLSGPSQLGLSSYAFATGGKFLYKEVSGKMMATDGYGNRTLQLKNLESVNKSLSKNSQYINSAKLLSASKPDDGLPANALKQVVKGLVSVYYPPSK